MVLVGLFGALRQRWRRSPVSMRAAVVAGVCVLGAALIQSGGDVWAARIAAEAASECSPVVVTVPTWPLL